MCRNTVQRAPIAWSSLTEHLVKLALFIVLAKATREALGSSTGLSWVFNSAATVLALAMIKGELGLLTKRLNRRLPPGYLGFPIVRDVWAIVSIFYGSILDQLDASRQKYGTMFTSIFFGRTNITVGGHLDLTWLFNNDRKALTEIAWPPNIVMLLGPGAVANQSGKYHRVLRRLLEPYFAPAFVTNYLKVMDETTLADLDDWCSTGEFVSSEEFKMYALRLFYASSFGRIDESIVATLHDDFKIWISGFFTVTSLRISGTSFDNAMKARDRILDTVDKLIDQFTEENPEGSERAENTIVGRLIYGKDKDNNRVMSRGEMKDNILNLIFAGHDTTYASISTLLHHLSQHKDAYDALQEEVTSLAEPLNANDLKNAPVLNSCIHESWRVDPPVQGSFRKAVKELHHKGYTFDKGTVFNYSILLATSDSSLYKDSRIFNFRRFLPKDHELYAAEIDSGIDPVQGRSNYPIFGGGTHVCLGKAFAMLEMRVLAARMLKHYDVDVRNSEKVFIPVNGWRVEFKLTRRKQL